MTKKDITLSTKGLLFGWPKGVPNASVRSVFNKRKWGVLSKWASKFNNGLDPSIQFPVNLSSSIVWTLTKWNFADGPLGVLPIYMYKSWCFRVSKYTTWLQLFISAISLTALMSPLSSSLLSFLWCGMSFFKSSSKWRYLAVMPLEDNINTRCLLV